MALPQVKPARYEDLFDLPENFIGVIINGRLNAQPRPAPRHARANSSLGVELGGPFDFGRNGPGGWWILDEPELHLRDNVLVPDIAGWRRERMPTLPDAAWFAQAPDGVCEILSPSTARIDRVEKLPISAANCVKHAWLVDPDLRTLEVFENQNGKWLLPAVLEHNAAVAQAPFDAVSFDLDGLICLTTPP